MSGDSINVALSAATLIVVSVASVAAIVQLRHLRTSNHLNGVLEIMNQWNQPSVQAALAEMQRIPGKMNDPAYVKTLSEPGSIDRAHHPEFLAMDFWEQIGTFVKRGLIDEDALLDVTSSQVTVAWRLCDPVIAAVRTKSGLSAFENFEYLAVRATLW
ncbi:MAG TPA: hypothetical protein VFE36_06560, partial [Candidatus Baltobacteraceae bacterium]|nr:hypothetical protein [Candidatus Baltobacteraceae bacterium]